MKKRATNARKPVLNVKKPSANDVTNKAKVNRRG